MQPAAHFDILLVDDDPTVIRVLSLMLKEFAPLRFATSGEMALKLAREAKPDLVLLDIEMPGVTGFEVCKAFKEDQGLAEVPILFVTSHDNPEVEAAGIRIGGADFIGKPPHSSLVQSRVRTFHQMKCLADTVRAGVTMDFLTGAVTRRRFDTLLSEQWLQAQRSGLPLALLIADICDFAALNAEFGDEKGDDCLRAVAAVLRAQLRSPTDVLGRYAGGKFALVLAQAPAIEARALAQRAIEGVAALRIPPPAVSSADRIEVRVGVCCGQVARATNAGKTRTDGVQDSPIVVTPADLASTALQALRHSHKGKHSEPVVLAISDKGIMRLSEPNCVSSGLP